MVSAWELEKNMSCVEGEVEQGYYIYIDDHLT